MISKSASSLHTGITSSSNHFGLRCTELRLWLHKTLHQKKWKETVDLTVSSPFHRGGLQLCSLVVVVCRTTRQMRWILWGLHSLHDHYIFTFYLEFNPSDHSYKLRIFLSWSNGVQWWTTWSLPKFNFYLRILCHFTNIHFPFHSFFLSFSPKT